MGTEKQRKVCNQCRHRFDEDCGFTGEAIPIIQLKSCPRNLWATTDRQPTRIVPLSEPVPTQQDAPRFPEKPVVDNRPITCDVVIPYHTATLRFVQEAINSILNQNHV